MARTAIDCQFEVPVLGLGYLFQGMCHNRQPYEIICYLCLFWVYFFINRAALLPLLADKLCKKPINGVGMHMYMESTHKSSSNALLL